MSKNSGFILIYEINWYHLGMSEIDQIFQNDLGNRCGFFSENLTKLELDSDFFGLLNLHCLSNIYFTK